MNSSETEQKGGSNSWRIFSLQSFWEIGVDPSHHDTSRVEGGLEKIFQDFLKKRDAYVAVLAPNWALLSTLIYLHMR